MGGGRRGVSVPDSRPAARQEQRPATARLRLQHERPHGASRRVRQVLRRDRFLASALDEPLGRTGASRDPLRRAAGLPRQSAQRSRAHIRAGEGAAGLARVFSSITTSFAAPDAQVPSSYQSSIGFQRQIGSLIAVEADYVHGDASRDLSTRRKPRVRPATGYNYPFTDRTRKPFAPYGWDSVAMSVTEAADNYQALQLSFTKRMSSNWQASAGYSLEPGAVRGLRSRPVARSPTRLPRPAALRAMCHSRCILFSRPSGMTRARSAIG